MKVLAINCSPHVHGNTRLLLDEVLKTIENEGIKTEVFQLGGEKVNGCIACKKCQKEKDGKCHQKNKAINDCIEEMVKADAIIIGSPTYYADLSTEAKALIDVSGFALSSIGNPLRHKPGAAVVAARRGGAVHTFDSINHYFLINEMIIPGSSYWNIGIGGNKGEVLNDEEGLETMRTLGKNMAWLLKKINP
ncbi:MAG TPA: flavodoxin family protein [Bacteroidales bacterium]|nr:flavodoxin family protein [Bacteroidales bacterium]